MAPMVDDADLKSEQTQTSMNRSKQHLGDNIDTLSARPFTGADACDSSHIGGAEHLRLLDVFREPLSGITANLARLNLVAGEHDANHGRVVEVRPMASEVAFLRNKPRVALATT